MKRVSQILKGGAVAVCARGTLALLLGGTFAAAGAQSHGEVTPAITAETFQKDREFLQRYEQKMPDALPLPSSTAHTDTLPGAAPGNREEMRQAMIASGRVEAEPPPAEAEPIGAAPEPARAKSETASTKAKTARVADEDDAPAPIAEKPAKTRKLNREAEAPITSRDSSTSRKQAASDSRSTTRRSKPADDQIADEPAVSAPISRKQAPEMVPVRRAVPVRAAPAGQEVPMEVADEDAPRHHGFFHRVFHGHHED